MKRIRRCITAALAAFRREWRAEEREQRDLARRHRDVAEMVERYGDAALDMVRWQDSELASELLGKR